MANELTLRRTNEFITWFGHVSQVTSCHLIIGVRRGSAVTRHNLFVCSTPPLATFSRYNITPASSPSNFKQLILTSFQLQSAAMGIDAGFDMDPPLSKGVVDRHNWDKFINFIKDHYKDDIQVEIKPNYINFKAGEHPKLPFEGHKFLRFSSKVSGSTAMTSGVERYIETVARVAHLHFGSRVKYWNEAADKYGIYDWKKVNESIRSYEQVRHAFLPTVAPH